MSQATPSASREIVLVCAGEAVIDLIPEGALYRPVAGGAALNSARAAARLGVPVGYLGALSRDPLGERLAREATADGVSLDLCLRSALPTPLSVAHLTQGDAQFSIHHQGTAAEALNAESCPALPPTARALIVGGFSLIHPPAALAFEALALTRAPDVCLYLDLNIRPGLVTDEAAYRDRLARLLRAADIVKASREDLDWWGGDLLAGPDALVIETLGARGASAAGLYVPVPRAEVHDTVGAGDIFNAAFLARTLQSGAARPKTDAALRDALAYAVRAASLSVSRPGATGPTEKEMSCAP